MEVEEQLKGKPHDMKALIKDKTYLHMPMQLIKETI